MGEIVFVGLGLNDELGISLRGLVEAKTANKVFIELYTSLMLGFSAKRFEGESGKKLVFLSRKDLEEGNGDRIFEAAGTGKTVLLVPGDPLIATTHIALRIEAEKRGIKTRIVHGASILSAAIGLSGLHNYKFGKSVTIPFPSETPSETPYETIAQNKSFGLHTLCLLDIDVEKERYLRINEALCWLSKIEEKRNGSIVLDETIAVGIARAGSVDALVKADTTKELRTTNFGDPPHTLVFPGSLHFLEAEALITFGSAPESLRGAAL